MKYSKNFKKYFPILIVNLFLTSTLFLFFFGPLNWKVTSSESYYLLLFMAFIFIFVNLGYILGVNKLNHTLYFNKLFNFDIKKKSFTTLILLISLTVAIITFFNNLHLDNFSIAEVLEKTFITINSPDIGYHDRSGIIIGGRLFLLFKVLFSPLYLLTFLFSYLYFRKMNKFHKFTFVLLVFFEILSWVVIGTNKGIFDQVFIFFTTFLVKFSVNSKSINFKKIFKFLLFSFILLFVFNSFIGGRLSFSLLIRSNFFIIKDAFLENGLVVNDLYRLYIYLTDYLTQGYFALAKSFTLSSPFYFGFGGSNFLLENIKEFSGLDFTNNLLQFKLEELIGYPSLSKWHSVYLYLANEFGFIFVPLYISLFSYLFGNSYKSIMKNPNSIDLLLFYLMLMFFLYSSGNNQIMQYSHTAFSFYSIVIFKIFTKFYHGTKKQNY